MNDRTVSLQELVWIVVNCIGFIASVWLMRLTLQRRAAVMREKYPLTPKGPRLAVASRQLRDRGGRAVFQCGAIIIGVLEAFDVDIPNEIIGWALIALTVVIAAVSIVDLVLELKR